MLDKIQMTLTGEISDLPTNEQFCKFAYVMGGMIIICD